MHDGKMYTVQDGETKIHRGLEKVGKVVGARTEEVLG